MSRSAALKIAPADPVGRCYAVARSCGREYLAWRDRDGSGGVQLRQREFGVERIRHLPRPPRGLLWAPVRDVWQDL